MKSLRSLGALAVGVIVSSVWACDSGTDDAQDGTNEAGEGGSAGRGGAQNASGRGGTQNESGRGGSGAALGGEAGHGDSGASGAAGGAGVVTEAGAGGVSGNGGAPTAGGAGAGGAFTYDEDLCDCSLSDDGSAVCTITHDEFHARISIPTGCDGDVLELETSECDDGTTRVRWIRDLDQVYLVVSETESGEQVSGRAAPYQNVCDTGERFEILSYGAAASESASCERTEYCCGDPSFCGDQGTAGAGGEAGSGS